jgi:hypothetical protein
LFAGSTTHCEIQEGLLGKSPSTAHHRGVLCALRRFAGQPQGTGAQQFVERDAERAAKVRQLTAAVVGQLPGEQVLRYTVYWHDKQGPMLDEDALVEQYRGLLRPKIEAVIAARTAARRALAA